jgi:hypothetical protein
MLIFKPDVMMKSRAFIPATLFAGLIFIAYSGSQSRPGLLQYPELAPLPQSQHLSTMREPLPMETIVDAALEFSGATDTSSAAAKEKLVTLLRRFRGEVADVAAQAELGERTLTFLHRNLLTNYSVLQTRVDTALGTGVYNCVSSAVLYMIFARSVGLSVGGVRTTDHAFCTVLANGQQVDVETTNPYGFNPGSKKEFIDSFGKVTGYSYVPQGGYSNRRNIGEKELLSLILYNRVSEYGESRFFRDALQPSVSAYALMGTEEMRRVMTIAFSNYVASLQTRQDYPGAIQFLDAVRASFGGTVDLGRPRRDAYHNWAVSLVDANALQDAEALLAQPAVRAALEESDWIELSVQIVQLRALAESSAGGFLPAATIVADGMKRMGRQPGLLQNYEAYMHNAFVPLYNARKWNDARLLIDQGLAVYPDSGILQQDLDMAKKALRQ